MAHMQCPTSDDRPPVPASMRSRYQLGALDEDGYILKPKPGYVIVLPLEDAVIKCRYCGKIVEFCGCGACR